MHKLAFAGLTHEGREAGFGECEVPSEGWATKRLGGVACNLRVAFHGDLLRVRD